MVTLFFLGFLTVATQLDAGAALAAPATSQEVATVGLSSSSSMGLTSAASVNLTFDPSSGPNSKQTNQAVALFKKAVADKNWFYAAGLLLFILVFLSRNILLPLLGVSDPEQYDIWLPRISAVLSAVPSITTKLLEPNVDITDLVSTSIGCYVLAAGAWKISKETMKKIPSVPVRTADVKPVVDPPAPPAPVEPKKEN